MTTETIEKTRIPGVPDKALVKSAGLSIADVRISWTLDEEGKKLTQAMFLESGKQIIAGNNTTLVAKLFDTIAEMSDRIKTLEAEAATNDLTK